MQCALAYVQGDIMWFSKQKLAILAAILDLKKKKMMGINHAYGSIIMPSIKKNYPEVSEESQEAHRRRTEDGQTPGQTKRRYQHLLR